MSADNAEAVFEGDLPANPTAEERIAQAGSRAEAARRVAFAYAIRELMPIASFISAPVPIEGPRGPALAFMLAVLQPDAVAQDYAIYEPELVVGVDAASLEPLGYERWREPVDPAGEAPIAYRLPPAACRLPHEQLDALEEELLLLIDRVGPLNGRPGLSLEQREQAMRLARLFDFLTPADLRPAYERLNPGFFAWLAPLSQLAAPGAGAEPPRPNPDVRPAPRVIPEAYELLARRHDLPPGVLWRLSDQELARALFDLRLRPAAHSPLAGLQPTDRVAPLTGQIEGWPTPEWRAALQTLCQPVWQIERLLGDNLASSWARLYVAAQPEGVTWVRYQRDRGDHLIAFPNSAEHLKGGIEETLTSAGVQEANPERFQLTPSELALVLAAADAVAERGELAFNLSLAALQTERRAAAADAVVGWSNLVAAISPLPLPGADAALALDVEALVAQGMLEPGPAGPALGPRLRRLAGGLGSPIAYAALWVRHWQAGAATVAAVALVRTTERIWLLDVAARWDPRDPEARGPLLLSQVSGGQVRTLLDHFLGRGEELAVP
jgi:hypothetical protein